MALSSVSSRVASTMSSRRASSSVSVPTRPSAILEIDRNNDDDHFFDTSIIVSIPNGATMVDVDGRAGFAPAPQLPGLWLGRLELGRYQHRLQDAGFRYDDTLFHNDDNFSANGLTFGGGVEWKFTENVSVRGDYRFTDLDNFGNNGHFDCDWCDNDRLPVPQRHRSKRPARAVHSQLALRRVRCHHGGGLLILALDTEVLASGPLWVRLHFLQPAGSAAAEFPNSANPTSTQSL